MNTVQRMHNAVVSAMFSLDLDEGKVDHAAVARIHDGDFDEWILAAARSGLFSPQAVEALVQWWEDDPKSLFDALLVEADEITRKRYEVAWNSLDEAASLEYA